MKKKTFGLLLSLKEGPLIEGKYVYHEECLEEKMIVNIKSVVVIRII